MEEATGERNLSRWWLSEAAHAAETATRRILAVWVDALARRPRARCPNGPASFFDVFPSHCDRSFHPFLFGLADDLSQLVEGPEQPRAVDFARKPEEPAMEDQVPV